MRDDLTELLDSYPHHEAVRTTDDDVIELRTCARCGAVVRGITVETHETWHEEAGV